jgi:hypothetical protein
MINKEKKRKEKKRKEKKGKENKTKQNKTKQNKTISITLVQVIKQVSNYNSKFYSGY